MAPLNSKKNLISAGILMYREKKDKNNNTKYKYLIGHPGGPFFSKKDEGYWSILKGMTEKNEDIVNTAIREFKEETGISFNIKKSDLISLGSVSLKTGKIIYIWAWKDPYPENNYEFGSNKLIIRYPPNSDNYLTIPEIDKHQFFGKNKVLKKLNASQTIFIERFEDLMKKK